MNDEKQVLKLAAERLLAVANGATLEWTKTGDELNFPWNVTVGAIGGDMVRIRPPAVAPEPKPSQAVLGACKRLGVEAWKLDRFVKGDRILGNGYVSERDGDTYGQACSPIMWTADKDQDPAHTSRYWHVRPIAATLPCPPKPTPEPKPSQECLDYADKWGCDIVGRRAVLCGDLCAGEVYGDKNDGCGPWTANSDMPHLIRWILRKRAPIAAPSLPCPPKPTPEQVAAARMPDGRRVKPPAVCEEPHGRAWFADAGGMVYADTSIRPHNHPVFGQRRWIAEPADAVVEPWKLGPEHAGRVVVRKDGDGFGIIANVRGNAFVLAGVDYCVTPEQLMRDWTHNGQPCGVAK